MNNSAPTNNHWLKILARIFGFLAIASVFLCAIWMRSTKPFNLERALSSDSTIIDSERLPFSIEFFALICACLAFSLLAVGICQWLIRQDKKGAIWSGIFALISLSSGLVAALHATYK